MSVKHIQWAFETECPSTSAKFVLVKLADNANDEGFCWPSLDYICRHTQLTRPTVIKAIKSLEAAGLITVVRETVGKVSLPNKYRLGGVVKEFNQGSKATLPGGSKAALPEPSPSEPSLNRQERDTSSDDDPPSPSSEVEDAFKNFNSIASACALPLAVKLTPARRQRLKARLSEVGLPGWNLALRNLEAAKWMHGDNDRGWRADFDFMLQPKSLMKLMEGSYLEQVD